MLAVKVTFLDAEKVLCQSVSFNSNAQSNRELVVLVFLIERLALVELKPNSMVCVQAAEPLSYLKKFPNVGLNAGGVFFYT